MTGTQPPLKKSDRPRSRWGPAASAGAAVRAAVRGLGRIAARRRVRMPRLCLAGVVLVLAVSGYGLLAVVGAVVDRPGPGSTLLSALSASVLMVLQLGYLSRPVRRPRSPGKYLALLAQAGLVVLPLVLFGSVRPEFPGLLAGSVLIVLPPAVGVPVFLLVVALATATTAGALAAVTSMAASTVTVGIAVYGLSTLVRLVVEAHDAQQVQCRAAVAKERLNFAEDLYELLGQSLSAIVHRGEHVTRLIRSHTDQACSELGEIIELSRQAMVDVRRVARMGRAAPAGEPGPGLPTAAQHAAPRLARVLLGIVLSTSAVEATVGVGSSRGLLPALVTAVVRLAELGVVLHLVRTGGRAAPVRRGAGLALLAVLVYAPEPFAGPYSHGAEGYLMGVALVVLPLVPAVCVYALAWTGAVLAEYLDPVAVAGTAGPDDLVTVALSTAVLSLLVYGLVAVARLVVELYAGRYELSRDAVARERVQFERDVHDLLGFGLATIALKCEVTGKLLVATRPERAAEELTDVLDAARRSLAEVRYVVSGHQALSIDDECRLLASTLRSADVTAHLVREGPVPAGEVGAVLVAALREGVTNVLRHSRAGRCDIVLRHTGRTVTLEIVNDGIGVGLGRLPDSGAGGSGLRNMAGRVASVGGELRSSFDGPSHRLTVRIPVTDRKRTVAR